MNKLSTKEKIVFLVFSFIAAISAYLKPLSADDYVMAMVSGTDRRISSVKDAFESANHIYMSWAGAYFTQFFTGLYTYLPQIIMYLTVVATLFVTLCYVQKISSSKNNAMIVIFLFFVLCPTKEQVLYWKMGFFAYAFSCPFFLSFIYYYHKGESKCLVLLALIAGVWHFPAIIPVSGALFFDLLFNYKQRTSLQKMMAIAFWVGALIVLFSPGTFNRTEVTASLANHNFTYYVNIFVDVVFSLVSLWILIAILILKKKSLKIFYHEHTFLNNCILISIVFYLLLGFVADFPAQRYFLCFHVFCSIVVLQELSTVHITQKTNWKNTALALIILGVLVYDINEHLNEHKKFRIEEAIIKNSNGGFIPLDLIYSDMDSLHWANKAMAKYYNVPLFSAMPSDLYYGLYLNNTNNKVKKFNNDGWKVISDTYYFKEIQNEEYINDLHLTWVKIIDIPFVKKISFVTNPNYTMFCSKDNKKFILLNNGKKGTAIVGIKDWH